MGNLHVVINRYDSHRTDFRMPQLHELLQVPHIFTVAYDGPHCADALNSGHVLRQESPRFRASWQTLTLWPPLCSAGHRRSPSTGVSPTACGGSCGPFATNAPRVCFS